MFAGLLCLKRAKQGGDSSWSSAVSVHNELLRRGRQDLVEELAKDQWYLDRKGEIPAGKLPYYRIPVFNYHQVRLSRAQMNSQDNLHMCRVSSSCTSSKGI